MNLFQVIYNWAKNDYNEWPLRFFLEILAWFASICCAITMALTVPNPPLIYLYPFFMGQCLIFGWAAWTRKSTGMMANYLLLVTIDSVGLARMLIS